MQSPRITTGSLMVGVLVLAVIFALARPSAAPSTWGFVPPVLVFVSAYLTVSLGIPRRLAIPFAVVAILVVPFLLGILFSKAMWGYFLFRPALDRRIASAREVRSAMFIVPLENAHGRPGFMRRASWSMARSRMFWVNEYYYTLEHRVLIALRRRGRLPDDPPLTDPALVARLYGVLERTGKLQTGWRGYPDAKRLRGLVLEATGADGKPLLFVAVKGGEVWNDHFPYYEFLFQEAPAGKEPALLSATRFFYDVSGLEGFEWPWVLFLGSIIGFIVTMGTLVPFARYRTLRAAQRLSHHAAPLPQPAAMPHPPWRPSLDA